MQKFFKSLMPSEDEENGGPPPKSTRPNGEQRRTLKRVAKMQQMSASSEGLAKAEPEEDESELEVFHDLPPVPNSKRKCTDVMFLLLFIIYWLAMLGLAFFAYAEGDPRLLVYGTDHNGSLCGRDELEDRPLLVWPRFSLDIFSALTQSGRSAQDIVSDPSSLDIKLFGICVNSCPRAGDYVCTDEAETEIDFFVATDPSVTRRDLLSSCVNSPDALGNLGASDCPSALIRDECFETIYNTTNALFRCFPEYVYETEIIEDESGCTNFEFYTNVLGEVKSRCARYQKVTQTLEAEPTDTDVLFSTFNTVSRTLQKYTSDIYKASFPLGVVGFIGSASLSMLYVSTVWFFVTVVVWTGVLISVSASVTFTAYCYFKAGIVTTADVVSLLQNSQNALADAFRDQLDEFGVNNTNFDLSGTDLADGLTSTGLPEYVTASDDYREQFEVFAYVMTAFTIALFLAIIVLLPKIIRATRFLRQASKAMGANLVLLFVPFFGGFLAAGNIAFFMFAVSYSMSVGTIQVDALDVNFSTSDTALNASEFVEVSYTNLMFAFLLLGFLWSSNVLTGLTNMTIGGVIAKSYWQSDGATNERYQSGGLLGRLYTTLRFHLGSIAFGSFILAIVQLLRYIAGFIQARLKGAKANWKVINAIFICLQCFIRCVERCVEYVSSASFIITAMYGTSFCTSSRKAFNAIKNNLATVGTVEVLGEIIQKFGQISVTLVCLLCLFFWLDNDDQFQLGGESELHSLMGPLAVVIVVSWYISNQVLGIYDVAVETIMLSYILDKDKLKLRDLFEKEDNL